MNTILYKTIKKAVKKNEDNIKKSGAFVPYSVSLRNMCKIYNVEIFFNKICDNIFEEIEKDACQGEFVMIKLENYADLRFDENGLLIFSSILSKYFDRPELIKLRKYLKSLNDAKRVKQGIRYEIDNLDVYELKQCIKLLESGVVKNSPELLDMYKTALDRKSSLQYKIKKITNCTLRSSISMSKRLMHAIQGGMHD
ncbi:MULTISPECIES: hypothetical protein [unclassified Sedimentibacter]|uniref:hypothetical protein n=1 Tax=unclassified Sedimentibacter TaxID=2649220 RepID=UPI0027E0231F|nr:hypothetical protein [Sedimentibacter sp. MB35-C1]WMJ78463.1 hypothetical protein RBQ61_05955 [Sedimentibacter sp. MB35-C1]